MCLLTDCSHVKNTRELQEKGERRLKCERTHGEDGQDDRIKQHRRPDTLLDAFTFLNLCLDIVDVYRSDITHLIALYHGYDYHYDSRIGLQ